MLISNSGINVPIPVTPDSGTFDPSVNMKNISLYVFLHIYFGIIFMYFFIFV